MGSSSPRAIHRGARLHVFVAGDFDFQHSSEDNASFLQHRIRRLPEIRQQRWPRLGNREVVYDRVERELPLIASKERVQAAGGRR